MTGRQTLWRISEYVSLDGRGGLIAPGRWHSKGRPIVYLAESSALAMLEVLVHLEVAVLPAPFQLIKVEADVLPFETWPGLPEASDAHETRIWGDAWLQARASAVARVPSWVAPGSWNWLLNPLHADAAKLRIVENSRYPWDKRLFKS